ncbi:hypothetical protein EMIHUDRAFT_442821 [Emiliania huxleyi CCMP1516]|uniref:Carboxymuconolactone decarboxylase-like domain-containing protein n=2 Tax=Emiliania huxleyi TaxID=2903 RepID=A0A0D3JZT1_EMIH1|nr:hypothetical protein EMIHUDRAFT_442821 [Emiliania huxleyi CCMP1516]EOD29016.1 hypothetical protein EMIHUDRAFT_442821 [Emiliania huxleyi CCMP1516]|eukprot:XP_005781445.1 hypothetical protein EMIHUDRAFT_442821 [Emiliania huxleyi CCMP1516]
MRVFSASRRRSSLVNTRRIVVLRAMALASTSSARLPPLQPPHLSEAQQELFDDIVSTRAGVVGKEALFDEQGGLRGPWNAEVASPHLGKHLERLASAVRHQNSLEPRLYEVAILVVGVHWRAQFEWYAHERLARKAGIAEAAFPLIKAGAPAERLRGVLKPDEAAVYSLALELMRTKRVSAPTYAATKVALGGDDRRMADLCMTMGCYSAVSAILNMFDVPLPAGEALPFLDQPADAASKQQHRAGGRDT